MPEQLQGAIITGVTVLLANWVTLGPMLKSGVKFAWTKTIEWNAIVNRLGAAEKSILKMQTDITAAHQKIRDLENKLLKS